MVIDLEEEIGTEELDGSFRVSLRGLNSQDRQSLNYLFSHLKSVPRRVIGEPSYNKERWSFFCYRGAESLAHLFEMMGADVKRRQEEEEVAPAYQVAFEGSDLKQYGLGETGRKELILV